MEKFKFIKKNKISQLPKNCGVYALSENRKNILYIGKARDIKKRVKNHFQQPSFRDILFLGRIKEIGFIKTDSEIEALILEAKLIKKYQPRFNILWRDDKKYFYVGLNKSLGYVFITHQPEKNKKIEYLGPFIEGRALKESLRFLRKIFPFYTTKKHPKNLCSWCHLGLCPGPKPNKKELQEDIKNLASFLKGKKNTLLKKMEKEMKIASKELNFEKAAKIRDQIFSLRKIISHKTIIKENKEPEWEKIQKYLEKIFRKKIEKIEAYDISNIQGEQATGAMITFIRGLPNKNFYRKFKIKISGKPNDTAMLKEVLQRRLKHKEWSLPDLILIDGGKGQFHVALEVLKSFFSNTQKGKIRVAALAKKENKLFIEEKKEPILLKNLPKEVSHLILKARDEAHRFAKKYHHKLREIDLKQKI